MFDAANVAPKLTPFDSALGIPRSADNGPYPTLGIEPMDGHGHPR